ncbi:MAG: flippase-like domain-containing protein [Planctomycetia bacterium]|nr:flippase-like domain-containing protein [Planctomycetia bacterium]
MKAPRRHWTRWLPTVAKLVVLALLIWFVRHTVVSAFENLGQHDWHIEPLWLVASGVLYLLGILPAAIFWHRVLVHADQEAKLGESLRAYYVSQLGKYVPGKWMVIVLRRGLLTSPGVENTVVAASVFFETLTMLAAGSALSALLLIIWHPDKTLLIGTALGSMLITGVPTVPRIFQWLIHVLRVGKLNPTTGDKLSRMGARAILIGWASISVGWLLQGISLWATLRAMGAAVDGPFYDLSLHTAAVSLAVVAGFLSQIPGGLGMREWVLDQLVQPQYGASVAIVSAILFRLVWLVSELVISIILYAVGWRRIRKPAAAVKPEYSASGSR